MKRVTVVKKDGTPVAASVRDTTLAAAPERRGAGMRGRGRGRGLGRIIGSCPVASAAEAINSVK